MDPAKTGTTMYGVKVFQPSQVPQEVWQDPAVSVVVSSYGSQPAILKDLEGLGVDPKRIITLYDTVESY